MSLKHEQHIWKKWGKDECENVLIKSCKMFFWVFGQTCNFLGRKLCHLENVSEMMANECRYSPAVGLLCLLPVCGRRRFPGACQWTLDCRGHRGWGGGCCCSGGREAGDQRMNQKRWVSLDTERHPQHWKDRKNGLFRREQNAKNL